MNILPVKNTVRNLNYIIPLVVIGVWAFVSIRSFELLDIPTGVYIFVGIFAGSKGWEKKLEKEDGNLARTSGEGDP